MKKVLFKKSGIEVAYTENEVTYDEALSACPKGYKMITAEVLGRIVQKETLKGLEFWFWVKKYDWDKSVWGPVAFGNYYNNRLNLNAYNFNQRASRGCYYKVRK